MLEYHANLTKTNKKTKTYVPVRPKFIDSNNTKPSLHTLFLSENQSSVLAHASIIKIP